MKTPTPKNPVPRKATPRKAPPRKRVEWVPYLPAIITALTAFVEVLLKHYHP